MKKYYLLLLIALMANVCFAQRANKPVSAFVKKNLSEYLAAPQNQQITASTQTSTPIWSDDFSVASHWTISNEVGNSDNWVIATTGPSGSYAIPAILSTTHANGFAKFDSDLLCSGNQIADITNATPINCTGHPGVLLKFQQYYRRFADSTFVLVSHDSINWVKYSVNTGFTNTVSSLSNPDSAELNISPVAGNQATVWIRFQFWSPSSYTANGAPGCGYAWMLDDIQLTDAAATDLTVTEVFGFVYSKVPSFLGQTSPNLAALTTNNGYLAASNALLNIKITKDGTNVFNQNGTPFASLPVAHTDTLTETTSYNATNAGNYAVLFTVSADSADNNPADNVITQNFAVTDTVFGCDGDFNAGLGAVANGADTTGRSNGYKIGNDYVVHDIGTSVAINSITFSVWSTQANLSKSVGEIVNVGLYEVDTTNTTNFTANQVAVSLDYTLTASDITLSTATSLKYITLPFSTGAYIASGKHEYVAVMEYLGNSGGKIVRVTTSEQPKVFKYSGTSFIYDETPTNTGWFYYADITPVVRMNMFSNVGINEKHSLIASMNCYPNPTADVAKLTFDLQEPVDVVIKISDIVGNTIATSAQGRLLMGRHSVNIALDKLAPGVYYCTLNAGDYTKTNKIMVVR